MLKGIEQGLLRERVNLDAKAEAVQHEFERLAQYNLLLVLLVIGLTVCTILNGLFLYQNFRDSRKPTPKRVGDRMKGKSKSQPNKGLVQTLPEKNWLEPSSTTYN